MRKFSKFSWIFILMAVFAVAVSCSKDEETPDVISSFTFTVDAANFKMIHFTNASQDFSTLSWNFGDNTALSNELNPVHTYAAVGTYTVTLTATGTNGSTDVYTETITIADPNELLTKLVGETSKVWKLLRVTTTGRYPLEVGPEDHSQIWWAMGKDNNELGNRPCMLNDEWTIRRDGTFTLDTKGDYWAEGGIFMPENICASTSDPMTGPNGEDLSAWGGGDFTFVMTPGATPTIKVNGMGAYLGFFKLGQGSQTKVPLSEITYNVVKLTDDEVDTLNIEGIYKWDPAQSGGYWRFVLMHYDDPTQEPPIPGNKPNVVFSLELNGLTMTCNNTTEGADSYLWDFGDGQTSTEMSPVHTYAAEGIYNVSLVATNANGSSSSATVAFVTATALTLDKLQGGAWKIRVEDKSVFVGSGLGKSDWWSVPKAFFTGGGTGGDDWSCMPDDEFQFNADLTYSYNTMGSARNDGYMGTPNGCFSDAQIAASGNGAAFGTCATHTYALDLSGARPVITLTNGAGFAAFIGFYKGYYGGENTNSANPPNGGLTTNKYEVMGYANTGTKEYLFVTVDITADHTGTAAWSAILER